MNIANTLTRTRFHPVLLAACAMTLSFAVGAAQPAKNDAIVLDQAWARATPPGAPVAGGFVTIRNTAKRADRLLSATSPDAKLVEIHEMNMDNGVMRMRRLDDGLAIAPNGTVELKPGGYHLMFIGPKHPFVQGETITATLRFEQAGTREVRFEVRAMGSAAPKH